MPLTSKSFSKSVRERPITLRKVGFQRQVLFILGTYKVTHHKVQLHSRIVREVNGFICRCPLMPKTVMKLKWFVLAQFSVQTKKTWMDGPPCSCLVQYSMGGVWGVNAPSGSVQIIRRVIFHPMSRTLGAISVLITSSLVFVMKSFCYKQTTCFVTTRLQTK